MSTTSSGLYNIYKNGGSLSPGVLHDLFGIYNLPKLILDNNEEFSERISIIDGLYKGLYNMGVKDEIIHKAFLNNGLDKLIHDSYLNKETGYYRIFCDSNINIGKTCY